jgi:glyoxylase-like metal-dependent hydrolase (beta-lactamase superfamily II)
MKQAALLLALVAACHGKSADTTAAGNGGAAGASAGNSDQVHAFKIGALDAVALKDGGFNPPNDGKLFAIGHSPEEVSAVLAKAGAPTDKFELSIQPLLVKDGDKTLLFDTGIGAVMPGMTGTLQKSLALAGVAGTAITDIFISHSHPDHIGGLVDPTGKLAFPNATIHISAPEWAAMQADEKMKPLVTVISSKVTPFEPGAKLLPEVTAVATIGHTPGHSSYDISSNNDHLFYLGDVAHSYVISVQKPMWDIQFDGDHAAADAMRVKTLSRLNSDKTHVYAVHFPFPGLGHIVGQGEDLSWQRD